MFRVVVEFKKVEQLKKKHITRVGDSRSWDPGPCFPACAALGGTWWGQLLVLSFIHNLAGIDCISMVLVLMKPSGRKY